MVEIPEYINLLGYLFVVLYMFSVPLESTRGEIIQYFKDINLMGRALLANFVIIPILGFIIARFFALAAGFQNRIPFACYGPGRIACITVCPGLKR